MGLIMVEVVELVVIENLQEQLQDHMQFHLEVFLQQLL